MPSVFISHAAADKELARDLARRIREAGLEADFLDEIPQGKSIKKTLREKIRSADAVLLLMTPAALNSQWTMTELGMAEGLNRPTVPVTVGIKRSDLPLPLCDYHVFPFDQVDAAIESLTEKLAAANNQ